MKEVDMRIVPQDKHKGRPLDPIAVALRNARKARGWSLDVAGEKTGIPAVVLGAWERGNRHPPIGKLREWVAAFGYELQVVAVDAVRGSVAGNGTTWTEYGVRFDPDEEPIVCSDADEAVRIAGRGFPLAEVVARQLYAEPWREQGDLTERADGERNRSATRDGA